MTRLFLGIMSIILLIGAAAHRAASDRPARQIAMPWSAL